MGATLVHLHRAAAAPSDDVDLGDIEDIEDFSLTELLERPVSAASGFAAKPSDSPTIVSTIEADEIASFGYRSLAEALRGMRGMYTGNDRNYSYLGARGFNLPSDYNTRFALSINEHAVNDPIYSSASPGLELGLPMIAIDRVQLVRGGASLANGSNALLGAIQVTTATGSTRPGLHVLSTTRWTAESYRDPADRAPMEWRGEDIAASYGAVTGGVDVFVAGAYTKDPGLGALYFPDLDGAREACVDSRGHVLNRCTGVVSGADGEEVGSAYSSISYKGVTLNLLASRRVKETPTASFATRFGDAVMMTDDRLWADLQYRKSTASFDVLARVAADYYGYRGRFILSTDPATNGGADYYTNRDSGTVPSVQSEVRARYRLGDVGDHIRDAELGVGSEAMTGVGRQWGAEYWAAGESVYLERSDRHTALALVGYATARLFDRVVGFTSMRAEYYPEMSESAVDPQLGVVLDVGTQGRLRASVGRGHRAPGLYERFYGTARGSAGNLLRPESSDNGEVSYERYLGDHVRLLVVGFHQDVHDLITVTEAVDQVGVYENRGSIHSDGLEVEVEGRWDALRWRSNYAIARAQDEDGDRPVNSPTSLSSLLVAAPVAQGRAEVGVQSFYTNERTSYDGTLIAPQFTTNLVLTVKNVVDQIDLTTGITNVFDQRNVDPSAEEHRVSGIPHDPRMFWIRLSLGLGRDP